MTQQSGEPLGDRDLPYPKQAVERFWQKVAVKASDECWEWTGWKVRRGYGRVTIRPTSVAAHHFSYVLAFGEIEAGKVVCHSCDNPSCVNPKHLFLGSQKENVRDMYQKGRASCGERHPSAKLTESDVRYIRAHYTPGKNKPFNATVLSKRFRVGLSAIHAAANGHKWKHIDAALERKPT